MSFEKFIESLRLLRKKNKETIGGEELEKNLQKNKFLFLEDPLSRYSLSKVPYSYSVAGIDGARTQADHHVGEEYILFLAALSMISYGQNGTYYYEVRPWLFSENGEDVSEEAAREMQLLYELKWADELLKTRKESDDPFFVILDGSIVSRDTEGFYKGECAWITYTSAARHRLVFTALGISDTEGYFAFLHPFTRSAWFEDPQSRLFVCYLHVGYECVRLETRCKDANIREKALACVAEQVRKGGNYPLVLYYAHGYTRMIEHYKKICNAYSSYSYSAKGQSKLF